MPGQARCCGSCQTTATMGSTVLEDASGVMMAAMALESRLSSIAKSIAEELHCELDSAPGNIRKLKAAAGELSLRLAEAKARCGDYVDGNALVNAAIAGAALKGTPAQKAMYLRKRGWKQADVGWDRGEFVGMPFDGAMDVQTREDLAIGTAMLK